MNKTMNPWTLSLGLLCLATQASAQPWLELQDPATGITCGLINAENVSLAIDAVNGELILLNGTDRNLINTIVTDQFEVVIDDQIFGTIEFGDDQVGRPRIFWVTNIGSLFRLNADGTPVTTEVFPDEILGNCDPCVEWDVDADCITIIDPGPDDGPVTPVPTFCGAGSVSAGMISLFGLMALRFVRRR